MNVFSVTVEAVSITLLDVFLAQGCLLQGLLMTIIGHFIVTHSMELSDVVPKFILTTFLFQ